MWRQRKCLQSCHICCCSWGCECSLDLTQRAQWCGFPAWLGHILTERPVKREAVSHKWIIFRMFERFCFVHCSITAPWQELTALVGLAHILWVKPKTTQTSIKIQKVVWFVLQKVSASILTFQHNLRSDVDGIEWFVLKTGSNYRRPFIWDI